MTRKCTISRQEAIDQLRLCGIEGTEVYLIDIIPLIEMIWADGRAQEAEIELLADFLKRHVNHINRIAGCKLLSLKSAKKFALRFLRKRPDPKLLQLLRNLIKPVRLATSDILADDETCMSLLAACLDIASSSVTKYPYGLNDRFNSSEKKCFFEILDSLEGCRKSVQI